MKINIPNYYRDHKVLLLLICGLVLDATAMPKGMRLRDNSFPNQVTFNQEENRRSELTANHGDLPIHVVKIDSVE